MAIATYSELQTAVKNWLDDPNGNQVSDDRVKEFIALAEADLNRRLRVRDNLTSTSGTTTAGTATLDLPSGFAGLQSLQVSLGGSYYPVKQMETNAAVEAYYGYASGEPQAFTLQASTLTLYPTPDAAYSYVLTHWQKLTALSNSNASNWLLTGHPDVYLFGALSHAHGFMVNDQRMATWRSLYEAAVEGIHGQSVSDGAAGAAFMYVGGGTP